MYLLRARNALRSFLASLLRGINNVWSAQKMVGKKREICTLNIYANGEPATLCVRQNSRRGIFS
jgi:hypothetical protein